MFDDAKLAEAISRPRNFDFSSDNDGEGGDITDKLFGVSDDESMKGYLNYLDDEASRSRKISCKSNYEKHISAFLKDVKSRDTKRARDASSALWTIAGNCKWALDNILIPF